MHKAFKTSFTIDKSKSNGYFTKGEELYKNMKKAINLNLANFTNSDGTLNGKKLTKTWFPIINADIFISHSHKDFDTTLILSGWLYEKQGIVCFIDSCVWGYANDLLKAIDKEFCYMRETRTYDYDRRNFSTSHVHMMLSTALTKMIYNTECLLFLNTPNSILPKDVINKNGSEETISPWIYTEIEMTRLIEKRNANDHRKVMKSFSESMEALTIRHRANLDHLDEITFEDIKDWNNRKYTNKYAALDALYSIGRAKGTIYG